MLSLSKFSMAESSSKEPELKHRVSVTISDPQHTMVSKRGEKTEKKIRLYAKDEKHAQELAKHHFKKQGYKVHDSNYIGIVEDAENVSEVSANTAMSYLHKTYDTKGYRDHTPQTKKGIERATKKVSQDAMRKDYERSSKLGLSTEETEIEEAIKLKTKVSIHAPGKDYHGKVGHVGEIRHGLHSKAPKTYTVDYDNGKSIQLDKKNIKVYKEETEQVDEVSMGLLTRYKEKAGQQASAMNKAIPDVASSSAAPEHKKAAIDALVKKGNKRFSGIIKATNKQFAKATTKEEAEINEAVSVKKKNYSWGKMVTVHHGRDTSYPLHPEHQAKIKALKPGEKTSFKDETNRTVHAEREDDKVHLSSKNSSTKTTVAHSHFTEQSIKETIKRFVREVRGLAVSEENNSSLSSVIKSKLSDEGGAAAFKVLKDAAKKINVNLTPEMLKGMSGIKLHRDGDYILEEKYNEEAKGLAGMSMDQLKQEHEKVKRKIESEGKSKMISMNHPLSQRARSIRLHMLIKQKKQTNEAPETYSQSPTSVPFTGGTKMAGTVTDKSGAKHTPMSRARHLARFAAMKQAEKQKSK